jgi:hypothetical protein
MKIIYTFFILVLLTVSTFAQSKNVLADGNPPLTQTMVNRLTTLLEWSLDTDLSAEERSELRSIVISYWKNGDQKSIKSTLDTLAFEERLRSADEAQKQSIKPDLQQELLKAFRQDENEPMSKILLTAYERNHAEINSTRNGANESFENLVGRWQVSHGNSLTTQNVNTGALGDSNAMIAEYDIKADGSLIYSFYLSQNNYGCTTKVKTSKTGHISINGSQVIFTYDKGTTTSSDSCNAKYNYTKPLGKSSETFNFTLKRQNGKPQFCFANDKLNDCAVKLN